VWPVWGAAAGAGGGAGVVPVVRAEAPDVASPVGEGPDGAGFRPARVTTPAERAETEAYWTKERKQRVAGGSGNPVAGDSMPDSGPVPDLGSNLTIPGDYDAVGKLFFNLDGRDESCTATVVHSENKDLVITHARCLSSGGDDFSNYVEFVPGYHDGNDPRGRYLAREIWVQLNWGSTSSSAQSHLYAVAFVVLSTDVLSTQLFHVEDRVLPMGLDFTGVSGSQNNPSPTVEARGYPYVAGVSTGEAQFTCTGTADQTTLGPPAYSVRAPEKVSWLR
jgi:hypothetical protein